MTKLIVAFRNFANAHIPRKSTGLNDQSLLIHCSDKNFLTIRHVLRITDSCIRIHSYGED